MEQIRSHIPTVIFLGLIMSLMLIVSVGSSNSKSSAKESWIELQHESNHVYIIRRSAILGYHLPEKRSRLKPSIMLTNGQTIATKQRFTIDDFRKFMEE